MKYVNSYYAITLTPSKVYSLIKQNKGAGVVFIGGEISELTANDFWAKRCLVDVVKIGNKLFFRI